MSYNSPTKLRTVSKNASGFLSARVSPFTGCRILLDPSRSFRTLLLPLAPYPSVPTSHHVLLSGKPHTSLCSEGQDLFLYPTAVRRQGGTRKHRAWYESRNTARTSRKRRACPAPSVHSGPHLQTAGPYAPSPAACSGLPWGLQPRPSSLTTFTSLPQSQHSLISLFLPFPFFFFLF